MCSRAKITRDKEKEREKDIKQERKRIRVCWYKRAVRRDYHLPFVRSNYFVQLKYRFSFLSLSHSNALATLAGGVPYNCRL